MAKAYKNLVGVAQLRASNTAVTATATDTELVGAKLADFGAGIFVAIVTALVGTGTYQLDLMGRDSAAGTLKSLATITPAANGTYVENVDRFDKRLALKYTLGGTNPSVVINALAIALEKTYFPDDGAIVTA